jgi:hypothetical protein
MQEDAKLMNFSNLLLAFILLQYGDSKWKQLLNIGRPMLMRMVL